MVSGKDEAMKKTINRIKQYAEITTIFFIDVFTILAIFHLSVFLRTDVLPLVYPGFPEELTFESFLTIWWIFIVWIFLCYYEGLYTRSFSFWDEIKALWKISFFSTVGVFVIVSIGKLSHEISRTVIVVMGISSLMMFPAFRLGAKKFLRRYGFFKRRVLILGAGETGRIVASALKREPNYGYEVIGFVDDDPQKSGKRIDGIKVHRGIDKALHYMTRCNIEDLFIAMPGAGKERLQQIVNNLQHRVERIIFVPDISGIAVLGTNLQHFFHEGVLAFEIQNNLSNPFNIFIKRCFDLAVSILLLPILCIPMAVISLLIRLDSKGPALFFQDRVGGNGDIFGCLKFRTMYPGADEQLAELFRNNAGAKNEWDRFRKLKDDPRVTRIGRFLRMTSLDELPQIFNVLKGEMSLVGPRPYLPIEVDGLGKHHETIMLTKPGITGLWQVSGRSDTNYDYRVALDLWYVRNWNLWLDIVILIKTIRIVIRREGAY